MKKVLIAIVLPAILMLSRLAAGQTAASTPADQLLDAAHKDEAAAQAAAGNAKKQVDPAQQIAQMRAQADGGDQDAAFQMGVLTLLGQSVAQDAAAAEKYFQKAAMTSARMCFASESYIETSLPGRVEAAQRWANAANSGCGFFLQAVWYGGNQLGRITQSRSNF